MAAQNTIMTFCASMDAAETDRGTIARRGIALGVQSGVNRNDDSAVIMTGTQPWLADYECSKTAGDRPRNQLTPIVFHPCPPVKTSFSVQRAWPRRQLTAVLGARLLLRSAWPARSAETSQSSAPFLFHVGMAKICFRAVNPDNATVTYETLRKESAL
jgi:hypothetical protein